MKLFKGLLLTGLLGFGLANFHKTDCVKIAGMNFFGEDLAAGLLFGGLAAAGIGHYLTTYSVNQPMGNDTQAINKLPKIGQDNQTFVKKSLKIAMPIVAAVAFLAGVFMSRESRIACNYNIWYGSGW